MDEEFFDDDFSWGYTYPCSDCGGVDPDHKSYCLNGHSAYEENSSQNERPQPFGKILEDDTPGMYDFETDAERFDRELTEDKNIDRIS